MRRVWVSGLGFKIASKILDARTVARVPIVEMNLLAWKRGYEE